MNDDMDFAAVVGEIRDAVLRGCGLPADLVGGPMSHKRRLEAMRAAFLRDIVENLHDDTPRLIFADWLDDQGGERDVALAEFIRVQCEFASLHKHLQTCPYLDGFGNATISRWREGFCQCRGCVLVKREDELVRFNASHWIDAALPEDWKEGFGTWRRPMPAVARIISKRSVCRELTFRRGFISEVRVTLAEWRKHGSAVARMMPLEVVCPTDKEPFHPGDGWRWYWMEEIPGSPHSVGDYWGRLRRTEWENGVPRRNCGYDSVQEAYDDLSETLLRVARA